MQMVAETRPVEIDKMATDAAGVAAAVQPVQNNVPAIKRAREFYRYLQPDNLIEPHLVRRASTVEAYNETVPSLSAALSPFCQFTALRLNARKAMLNVMDRDVVSSPHRCRYEGCALRRAFSPDY